MRPKRRVGEALEPCHAGRIGDDVLVEAQVTAGADDAKTFGERGLWVGHGAQHERNDPGVEGSRLARETITNSIDH
jgi:hypothetical protein